MNAIEEKVVEVARFVRAQHARGAQRADLDDIEQEAALWALETARRYPIRKGVNPFSFLAMAAFRRVSMAQKRQRSSFTISERGSREGKVPGEQGVIRIGAAIARGDRLGALRDDPAGGLAADDRVRSLETQQDITRARVALRGRLDRLLAEMTPEERRAAEILIGMDDGEGGDPKEVAWRTGMSWAQVRGVVRKLSEIVDADPEVRRLWGVISGER